MNPNLFIVTITLYLVSLVATLVGAFFSRFVPARVINTLVIFHFLSLMFWVFMKNGDETVLAPGTSNYLFLAFTCSGIFVSAILLRKEYPVYMKAYFFLFLLTLPVFLFTPSRLLGFIASGNPAAVNPVRFRLLSNYYLVELPGSVPDNSFKLVREMGIFHKTLARNVVLPEGTDSVRLLDLLEDVSVSVRTYSGSQGPDSADMVIPFGTPERNDNQITRKPNIKHEN